MRLQSQHREQGIGGHFRRAVTPIAMLAAAGLTGCLADDIDTEEEGLTPGQPTYTISGQASGITEGNLQLTLNGDETVTLSNDGSFTFSTRLEQGEDYTVTVDGHPDHSYCDLSNAQGSMPSDHVDNVTASCEVLSIGATNANRAVELDWNRAGDVTIAYSTDSDCDWVNASSCSNGGMIANQSGGSLTVDESDGLNMNELYSFALMVGDQASRPAQGTLTQFELSGTVNDTLITNNTLYAGGDFMLYGTRSQGLASYRGDTTEAKLTGPVFGSLNQLVVYDSVADPNGGRFVAGVIESINGNSINHLARLNEDGSLDTSWSANITGNGVVALAVDENQDRLFIGGAFSSVDGNTSYENLAALNLDGSLDTSFASESPDAIVWDMDTSSDHLFIGGLFSQVGSEARTAAAALDIQDGTVSTNFTPDPDATVRTVLHDQGRVYLGGAFSNVDGTAQPRVAAVDATDGSIDTGFDPAPDGTVYDMALIDGQLVFAGVFENVGSSARTAVAAADPQSGDLSTDWDISLEEVVTSIAADADHVYLGGVITEVEGASRHHLVRVDRASQGLDTDWAPRIDSNVLWHVAADEHVYAGGEFRGAEGQVLNNLAAFDLATGELIGWDAGTDDTVEALAADSSQLFVGGRFSEVYSSTNTETRDNAAAFDLADASIQAWDPQPDDDVLAIDLNGVPDQVFLGGRFQNVGVSPRKNLAAVDTGNGAVSGTGDPDLDGAVRTISYFADQDAVLVGGSFRNAGATLVDRYVIFNDSTDFTVPTAGASFNAQVYATYIDPANADNHFVGGAFTQVNGSGHSYVAWLDNGATLNANSPDADHWIRAIDWEKPEQRLVFGGRFSTFDGDTRDRVAIMDFDGTNITNVTSPTADGSVRSISQNADTIVLGGSFLNVDSERSPGLIALDSSDLSPAWPASSGMSVSNKGRETEPKDGEDSSSSALTDLPEDLRDID